MRVPRIFNAIASTLVLAFVVYSCKSNLAEAQKLDLSVTPIQVVDTMLLINSDNGRLKMRVEALRMEVYEYDTLSYNYFPKGINVFGYNEDEIVSSDIIGMRYGSLFDATQTMVLPLDNGTTQVQVVSWYDNENSYTSQMVRTIKHFGSLLGA